MPTSLYRFVFFIFFEFSLFCTSSYAAESVCYGTPSIGRLENGVKLPASGKNFKSYSTLGYQLGRTYVHSQVQRIALKAYEQLLIAAPDKTFMYGETSFAKGGSLKPHRTHQNGTSVDFMVPVMQADGESVPLPANALNKFGYGIDFDAKGKLGDLVIDFEAIAEHLYQLDTAALQSGNGLVIVIFEPQYHSRLFATKRGNYIKKHIHFMEKPAWIRHDEHYHVDFKIACRASL